MTAFKDLGLPDSLLKVLSEGGFDTPTEIQEKAIPAALDQQDIMACAQTGTGKTAAFSLPLLARLLESNSVSASFPTESTKKKSKGHHASRYAGPSPVRALILTPTRELADQVLTAVRQFARGLPIKAGLVVGGAAYGPQIQMLKRPLDVLVATPGRLIDHLEEGRCDLSACEFLVLDEADRMLDMGFLEPVKTIVSHLPKQRQTLLFSATFSKEVEKLTKRFLVDPVEIRLAASTQRHENITQSLYYASGKEQKTALLQELLAAPDVWQAIVFMRTKHATERLAAEIASWGHKADALHGDMRQSARKRVIEKMHKGKVSILVATDVAARGIDVKELTHVFNFDLPQVSEDYIHRIGRTGRAGATGHAVSFVSRDEIRLLNGIEKLIGQRIQAENEAPPRSKGKSKSSGGERRGGDRRFNGSRSGGGRSGGARSGGRPGGRSGAPSGERGGSFSRRDDNRRDDRRDDRREDRRDGRSEDRGERRQFQSDRPQYSDRPRHSDRSRNSDNPRHSDRPRSVRWSPELFNGEESGSESQAFQKSGEKRTRGSQRPNGSGYARKDDSAKRGSSFKPRREDERNSRENSRENPRENRRGASEERRDRTDKPFAKKGRRGVSEDAPLRRSRPVGSDRKANDFSRDKSARSAAPRKRASGRG